MKPTVAFLAITSFFTLLPVARAEDYQGADSILKQIAAAAQPAKTADTPEKFHADLAAFRKAAAALPPDKAAKAWLDLADRFPGIYTASLNRQISRQSYVMVRSRGEDFSTVLAALPPPAAWPALAKAADARPADGADAYHTLLLRLIAHRLTHDNAALNNDFNDLAAYAKKTASAGAHDRLTAQLDNLKSILAGLDVPMAVTPKPDDSAEIVAAFEKSLAAPPRPGGLPGSIAVPDLVILAGADKAAGLLRRALSSYVMINSISGDETAKLARKLALEMMADLKAPQWTLAHTPELFEAMEKRFPKGGTANTIQGYGDARQACLFALFAAHRMKEAEVVASSIGNYPDAYLPDQGPGTWRSSRMEAEVLPPAAINPLVRAGSAGEFADFFHDLLAENPGLPFWANYIDVAIRSGQQKKMIALAEAAAAKPGLNNYQRWRITGYLRCAYLATDRTDDGIALLREEIEEAKKNPGAFHSEDLFSRWGGYTEENVGLGLLSLKLARLGALLNRKDLTDEGVRDAIDALKKQSDSGIGNEAVATLLIELGRGPEAEAVLKDALLALSQGNPDEFQEMTKSQLPTEFMVLLMDIYDRANRPADVLALLDHAPFWNAGDLSGILTKSVTIDRNIDYAGYFAAKAFAATGKTDEARKVLDALMDQIGNYDPAYELLLKIAPRDEAPARLDALFARDKFEPRPLIWKAKLLLDAGKLEEAEAAARQAMEIDPSDGEQGPGRRMRVYSVLADIRDARGDKKEAENYRGAVTAIRQSEDADRFYEAGLTTRAIKMYDDSLSHFADAYCIQSRLALRMAEIGDFAGAQEHYQRAYELMPDSFGRVESHCFGCEGVFDGDFAQGIADKALTEIVKKRPDKPQAHYLLGYLRKEEARYDDALAEFQQAVKLDPDYLNAWTMIDRIDGIAQYITTRVPAPVMESVELNLMRLDPLGRHSDFNAGKIIDLTAAWNAQETIAKLRAAQPPALYPLAASADEIEKAKKQLAAAHEVPADDDGRAYPGFTIAKDRLLSAVAQIYSSR